MSSSLYKRKLQDYIYAGEPVFPINHIRMRKDQTALHSSSNSPPCPHPVASLHRSSVAAAPRTLPRLQFFVRILSEHTVVLHADPADTIKSIHEKIQSITGIPIIEQRLIYHGKQLQWEQTLAECGVQNDAGLHLVGRMRSTGHPQAWQLINDVVSLIFHLYKNNPPLQQILTVPPMKSMLLNYLSMTRCLGEEQVPGHLQIFNASSAPAALVMLYMSSHKPNKEAADDAIKHFITSCRTVLSKHAYQQCVPIVLEFCRLLSRTAGTDDQLYSICRSSLGAMVECIDQNGEGKKGFTGLGDIFPFVNELAAKLSHDMVLSTKSCLFDRPSAEDVKDFSAFVAPVRNEIKDNVGIRGPIVVPLSGELLLRGLPPCYTEAIINLKGIYVDLLHTVENCMKKMEERMEWVTKHGGERETVFFAGCAQYLGVLKELNSISKVYYGCEDLFWETMKRRKSALCYLIVKYAERSGDHKWILDCEAVTNFEARRHLAMMLHAS